VAGAADPTGFVISRELPVIGPYAFLLLTLGLLAMAWQRERHLRRE